MTTYDFVSLSGPNVCYVSHVRSLVAALKFTRRTKMATARMSCHSKNQQALLPTVVGLEQVDVTVKFHKIYKDVP